MLSQLKEIVGYLDYIGLHCDDLFNFSITLSNYVLF